MALMERVATLLRANVNDLLERAEDPEKLMKQLVLDMENQALQVKTQVAMALADQHLLEKKALEQEEAAGNWHRKAELALTKGDEALARAALERALRDENMAQSFRAQVADQAAETEALRLTYTNLQAKLRETQAQCEVLIAQHRRSRMVSRAIETRTAGESGTVAEEIRVKAVRRMKARIQGDGAQVSPVGDGAASDSLEERLARLETEDRVEQLLAELKSKHRLLPTG